MISELIKLKGKIFLAMFLCDFSVHVLFRMEKETIVRNHLRHEYEQKESARLAKSMYDRNLDLIGDDPKLKLYTPSLLSGFPSRRGKRSGAK
jgi:hypothetical protein